MPDTGMSGTWRLLWQDGWLRALTCWLPLLLFGWMTWLFNGGQVREMPVGLVDLDTFDTAHLAGEQGKIIVWHGRLRTEAGILA